MKCSRNLVLYFCQCIVALPELCWANHSERWECSYICVSKTSYSLVHFAFWLGDAKDDAKLKKCVSTRYATVLILLTIKCEYCKALVLKFLCSFRQDCYVSIKWIIHVCFKTCLPWQCRRMLKCYRNWLQDS